MLSKELRQLKHLFSGYKKLIERLGVDAAPKGASPYISLTKHAKLSHVARDRFSRLSDRIQMLMLNTIQEYSEEKVTLSNTVRSLKSHVQQLHALFRFWSCYSPALKVLL